jgi:hypothetical protein
MRRDRELHRLRLTGVEDLGRDVLVDLVQVRSVTCGPLLPHNAPPLFPSHARTAAQDVCIELDLGDATQLPGCVRKLMRVVSAAPRMEAFIAEASAPALAPARRLLPHPQPRRRSVTQFTCEGRRCCLQH